MAALVVKKKKKRRRAADDRRILAKKRKTTAQKLRMRKAAKKLPRNSRAKKLSNPFSTGGGGNHFEAHVQASLVAVMLTGGCAPCLPPWPIVEIKLQGKVAGYDTDDMIVFVEDPSSRNRRKMLGQIKHAVSFTSSSAVLSEVLLAAWNDFKNPQRFSKGRDVIALIAGPLSVLDRRSVGWLLEQARRTKDVDEFLLHVQQANFSPPKSDKKLAVIKRHLRSANGGLDLSAEELYSFLRHFYLLEYDLGEEGSVVQTLLHSHISQYVPQNPDLIWSRIVVFAQTWNRSAGTIVKENLPEDLRRSFQLKRTAEIPQELAVANEEAERKPIEWAGHPDANYLSLAVLLGAWSDRSKGDIEAVSKFLGIGYDQFLLKAQEMLHHQDSPLSLTNGVWRVVRREELWKVFGSRLLDQNLDKFKSLAVSVLGESDPAFDLDAEDRYMAPIHGKVLQYSNVFRKGIAEGLAILKSESSFGSNCSVGHIDSAVALTVRELLKDTNWIRWGSLNGLLPDLAEADPEEFLASVEAALSTTPCPFDELFLQEGRGISGGNNYLTGLLWALEGLAWDEKYLVRSCVILAELATRDAGGKWANRPSSSLVTILLPWLPQTLASVEKRKVAVRTVLSEFQDVGWQLLIQLLPGRQQSSSGTYKPRWRIHIPDSPTQPEEAADYWQQATYYSSLAIEAAGSQPDRLAELAENFDHLPKPAFDRLLDVLSSPAVVDLPEEKRTKIWDRLSRFAIKHRRFSTAKWALPDELISRIESVSQALTPADPVNLYRHLFSDRESELYEESGNWEEQRKKLEVRRDAAVAEVLQRSGVPGVILLAESVVSPNLVGYALGGIEDSSLEEALIPQFLTSTEGARAGLVGGFIWRRQQLGGWKWADDLDRSLWTQEQTGSFLAYMPFVPEAWERALRWMGEREGEYWSRTNANAYQTNEDLSIAVDRLIEHGRPHAAVNALDKMQHDGRPLNSVQVVRALMAVLKSNEQKYSLDTYHILELIKVLQADTSLPEEELFKVEWAYLPLLDHDRGSAPKVLEGKLAKDPEFFCDLIRLIYRSKKQTSSQEENTPEEKAIANNAWRLLREWRTVPGIRDDGMLDAKRFNKWLQKVKERCEESGHLEVALVNVGQVLVFAPADPDGLWIHRTIASALNHRDAEDMRRGFRTATYNSRGVHWVDPTGAPEMELATKYRSQADQVENAGYQRFAAALRVLADTYEREAERVIRDHNHDGQD